ncbi:MULTISPECIES: sulfate adenylyltransferase subunit 1 [unclassified Thiomonas]|uniref:sulfate adenylyltransferase subunit 1 n=1 Tax=unclassified Thiomonas TaxID=2625466 RepID=UPI0004DB9B54|nr:MULTISPECIES: GTP-binding protein [unclassified Thiomonas]CQR45701.1 sulfate adenylyltransferase, subunit 1 [Thiomonas sp. CB3]CDW96246.1 sulfate adenylyltransferase, subunit 1 [Thiomonas sp. CB2]VDY06812.1 sulfate adenylyltransferase, subunit 1 [Thiomonas sp. Bio17B3]VDY09892.1 sulfate adenylyltransferase, subunit 1 [Thiomonas sp. Sup16B3]VDY11131.1 sulfate adenylyltransferase, subunit 1 [Thiomonas sp. Sup16B3]
MNTHNDANGEHRHKALRFLTAGSVDDGKSTLIGRLLLDSRAILADQLDALQRRAAGGSIDLSQLTDGLEAEREQGITIDVAYRYFTTPRRKFIIADAPGHEQYTRNMVTAAAGSDAAVVLIDITKLDWRAAPLRLLPQTRRHTLLARLLRLPSIVFAVNKLDAVDDAEAAFAAVRDALLDFAAEAGIAPAGIVPVSALRGDNIAIASTSWPWYAGPTLLQWLEALPAAEEPQTGSLLLPVQYVAREGDGLGHQPRTVWGRIARGQVQSGDKIRIHPSGESAEVVAVRRAGVAVDGCAAGQSAGLVLDRQVDISRGDWIESVGLFSAPKPDAIQRFEATLAWLDTEPAVIGRKYWLRHGHRWVAGHITAICSRLDIHTLTDVDAQTLAVNDIGRVRLQAQSALPLTTFVDNRVAGAMIVVDPASHRTSGALLVEAVQ